MKKNRLLADFLLLLFLLSLSMALFFVFRGDERGGYAEIVHSGVSQTVSLKTDRVLSVTGENGITLSIRIEGGEIFVESAGCIDKVCVKRGRLSKSGDLAVCLPAGISIRVLGEGEVDAYA